MHTALPSLRRQVKALLAAIERNSAWVGRQRDAMDFSPKDLASCEAFLSQERAARQVHRPPPCPSTSCQRR